MSTVELTVSTGKTIITIYCIIGIYNKGGFIMVLKISTKKGKLPIEIGELTFHYDITDEGQAKLLKGSKKFEKKIKALGESDLSNLDVVKELLEETFDFLLGEGAFEKIYNQSPSTIECMDIAYELMMSLAAEMQQINAGLIEKVQSVQK